MEHTEQEGVKRIRKLKKINFKATTFLEMRVMIRSRVSDEKTRFGLDTIVILTLQLKVALKN